MKSYLLGSLLALASLTSLQAHSFSVSSVNGGAATGSTKLNFNDLAFGAGSQWVNSEVQVNAIGNFTGVVQGASSGRYAAPFLSGTNGVGFGPGGSDQANGADATKYMSVGAGGSITFTFNSAQKYFGLLWGSVDSYNLLEFYNGASLVGSFTGNQIWANANGNQGAAGTYYVNFTDLDGTFNKVVAKSSGWAFEFDNVAYSSRIGVPDTSATVGMFGVALLALAAFRRRR